MNEFMKVAIDCAMENLSTHAGGPFGACVVLDGKIVGKGSNQVLLKKDPTLHAEVVAIRDACANLNTYDLSGCEIYTTGFPCPMCLSAIMWANIKRVYYGNTLEDTKRIGFRDDFMYDYIANMKGGRADKDLLECTILDRYETLKIYEEFSKNENNTIY